MPPQDATRAYAAASDVAQLLMHCDLFTDAQVVARVKALSDCHAKTLYNLAENKLFFSLSPDMQDKCCELPRFCDKDGKLCIP